VVHRPLHCVVACYGASFSPCIAIVCYGPLSLTLRYYCLLWYIILCLVLLLFVVVHHLCRALLLLFVMVHHLLPCDVNACYSASPLRCPLFACWGDVLPPLLPCAGYGDWSMKCYVLSSKITAGFLGFLDILNLHSNFTLHFIFVNAFVYAFVNCKCLCEFIY